MVGKIKPERHNLSLDVLLDDYKYFLSFKVKTIQGGYFSPKDDDELIAPYIIKIIRDREKQKREQEQQRVYIEDAPYEMPPKKEEAPKEERGILIIDITGENDYL